MPAYNVPTVVPPARPFRHGLPTLSPSKVADLECPKRFGAKHIERILPAEPWSHALTYGSGLHKVMFDLYRPGRVPTLQRDITAFARAAFPAQNYPDSEVHNREADILRATQTATHYLATDTDAANTIQAEADEYVIVGQSKGEPIKLSARFDRLVTRPDESDILRIVDYKTGNANAETNLASATLTMVVAKLAFKDRFSGRQPLLCYDFVDETGLVRRVEVTVDQVRDQWKPLHEAASAVIHGGERDEVPGPHCQFCPLRAECRPVYEASDDLLESPFAD